MVEIRDAQESDLDDITRLWRLMMDVQLGLNEHFRLADDAEETFREAARAKLAADNTINLVAQENGRIVGFCFSRIEPCARVYVKERYCLISDLSIDPEARRKGIAAHLWSHVQAWCREQAVRYYEVNVANGNQPAQEFWRRQGFGVLSAKFILDENRQST